MKHTLDELIQAWQEYAPVALALPEAEEERAYADLASRLLAIARQDSVVRDQLRDVASGVLALDSTPTHSGSTFADMVSGLLTPYPDLALHDPAAFLDHVEVGFTPEVMPIAPALVLPVASQLLAGEYADHQLDYPWTWFAGTPVGLRDEEWPRRRDGMPLHHVVQVALGEEAQNVGDLAALGLPETGVLQLFHDLITPGEPGDSANGAWVVRWHEDADGRFRDTAVVLSWPADLPDGTRVAAVPANPDLTATIPSPLNQADLNDAEFERYERVRAQLDWWPYVRNRAAAPRTDSQQGSPWSPGYVPAEPVSRLGGFPHCEVNPDHVKTLESGLPLRGGDRHVLLADINPGQFTGADWFHGGRHLEVWIRASDLVQRRFDDVWCLIRTDC